MIVSKDKSTALMLLQTEDQSKVGMAFIMAGAMTGLSEPSF
jgi:hypothetical protein